MFALLVDLLHVTQEMPNRGEPQKQTDDYNCSACHYTGGAGWLPSSLIKFLLCLASSNITLCLFNSSPMSSSFYLDLTYFCKITHTLWGYPEPLQSQCLVFHIVYKCDSDDPKLSSKFLKNISSRSCLMQLTDNQKLLFTYTTDHVLSFLEFESLTEIQVLWSLNQDTVNDINIRWPIIIWGEKAGTQKWHLSLLARLVRNKLDRHCPV